MVELAKDGRHNFCWNVVDFEADWKSVQDRVYKYAYRYVKRCVFRHVH